MSRKRLADIRLPSSAGNPIMCSYCGELCRVTSKDPICSARSIDDTMRRLKRPFHAKVGSDGAYHIECMKELGRERRRLDDEKRERIRAKRSAAARRRFHGAA